MQDVSIDTNIEIETDDRILKFTLPYVTHVTKEDVLDDGEVPYKGRVCFRTTDSKLDIRTTLASIAALNKLDGTTLKRLRISSMGKTLKMRNVGLFVTKKHGEIGIEFESMYGDVGWN